jgi:hypothetical protein
LAAHLLVVYPVLLYQLQNAKLGSTVCAMVVHFLQDQPHVILPPSGKAVCDSLFSEGRSSFGTRHESQAEERTEEISDALPGSLEMTKIKGTALRETPFGSWNVNSVKEACRADSNTMDKAQFMK